jgi:hypothetical protein
MKTSNFKVDGYFEHSGDIYNGYFEFKQEENRVLYPFMKIRQGGTNDFPQYCYIMKVAEKSVHEVGEGSSV